MTANDGAMVYPYQPAEETPLLYAKLALSKTDYRIM